MKITPPPPKTISNLGFGRPTPPEIKIRKLYVFKTHKTYFSEISCFTTIFLKITKTHRLSGFGAPGVLKTDPACTFHANSYGRI